ncbi:WD40 repeat-like protein [Rickenella mellea]|uniref:WD40 repeat-like protein n=1 Tax=Rickenella mellea TaxID=50990 RepID=A0A4Y7QKE3_9AGAM|nr:WD40 repeat-like protein [Rickenella mellea]
MAATQVSSPGRRNANLTPKPTTKKVARKSTKGKEKESGNSEPSSTLQSARPIPTLNEEHSSWAWTTLAEASASTHPAVFTKDGGYFFSIVGPSVKIYSTVTGKVVSTISPSSSGSSASRSSCGQGHTDLVTAAILHPQNPFQLLTASLDGFVKIWDFLDAVLLQSIDVGMPISHMCANNKLLGHVFLSVQSKNRPNNSRANSSILRVSLDPANTTQPDVQGIKRVGTMKSTNALEISPSGEWLVAIAGCKAYAARTSSLESGFAKFVSPYKLTCLAFHPSEEYFATGDQQGQIRLWFCLNEQTTTSPTDTERRTQTTVMHWHAHAVSTLAFTPNGAYLLSGGEECVLVIWQLHTGKKEFVPRVGAPILSIAIRAGESSEEYLLGLADSSFITVNSGTLSISRTISRIRIDPVVSTHKLPLSEPVPLAAHPLSSSLILPSSHPSFLQTYSPSTATLLSELEVSPSNRVSRRDEMPIEPSRVERVVICESGEWMATLDRRGGDDNFSAEMHLKLWHWQSTWILNSRVDRPHGVKSITAMEFSPCRVDKLGWVLATSGLDGSVKTWSIRAIKSKNGKTDDIWINRSSLSFRGQLPSDLSWSPDASLLVVTFERHITIHDPVTNALLDSLTSSEIRAPHSNCFVGRSGRYLATHNERELILWDLVTRSVCLQHRSPHLIARVVPHPNEDLVAIFEHPFIEGDNPRLSTRVTVFRPSSGFPEEIKNLPFRLRMVTWFSDLRSRFSLAGITYSWDIVLFGDHVHLLEEEGTSSREIVTDIGAVQRRTLFQDIFGDSSFGQPPTSLDPPMHAISGGTQDTLNVFSAPTYLSPPLETMYSSLLQGLLRTRNDEKSTGTSHMHDDVDEDVAMDIETTQTVSTARRVVDDGEIGNLVGLFKSQAIRPPTVIPPDRKNGVPNGVHKTVLNGASHPKSLLPNTHRTPPHPVQQNVQTSVTSSSTTTSSPSAPTPTLTSTNKKRKKLSA